MGRSCSTDQFVLNGAGAQWGSPALLTSLCSVRRSCSTDQLVLNGAVLLYRPVCAQWGGSVLLTSLCSMGQFCSTDQFVLNVAVLLPQPADQRQESARVEVSELKLRRLLGSCLLSSVHLVGHAGDGGGGGGVNVVAVGGVSVGTGGDEEPASTTLGHPPVCGVMSVPPHGRHLALLLQLHLTPATATLTSHT